MAKRRGYNLVDAVSRHTFQVNPKNNTGSFLFHKKEKFV